MTDLSEDLLPPYYVEGIEFRDRIVIVNYAENDDLQGPFNMHKSIVIPAKADEDCDTAVGEILDSIYDLINAFHIAKRNPSKALRR